MNTTEFLLIAGAIVPDRPAVIFEGQQFTFEDLGQRVNRLANALSELGVGAGDRVAIMQVNTNHSVETYFAAAQLDAIYVPVNFRAKAQELRPDVIIMDSQMPNMDGLKATELIKQLLPQTAVLMFSVFRECAEAGMKMGADGCLTKDCDPEDLIAELRRVAARISSGG